ncbi:MAG TPA: hypothetical protein VOA78_09845 [Candidatus Dormibacteraeota bacterium]|nr:hypothetical protein [Candidatus Dormibacteraeota bacterium]
MKSLTRLFLFAVLLLPLRPLHAQEKTPDKPKPKASVAVKVQIVFTEMDGDKKISSLPYSFIVLVEDKPSGRYAVNLRTGVRVPIEVDGKDQKTTYMDVGANIDCGIHEEEDGKFRVSLNFERSVLYPNKSAEGERLVNEPNGQPLVRQFRASDELLLRDGQTSDVIMSTDPLNGHLLKLTATINIQK